MQLINSLLLSSASFLGAVSAAAIPAGAPITSGLTEIQASGRVAIKEDSRQHIWLRAEGSGVECSDTIKFPKFPAQVVITCATPSKGRSHYIQANWKDESDDLELFYFDGEGKQQPYSLGRQGKHVYKNGTIDPSKYDFDIIGQKFREPKSESEQNEKRQSDAPPRSPIRFAEASGRVKDPANKESAQRIHIAVEGPKLECSERYNITAFPAKGEFKCSTGQTLVFDWEAPKKNLKIGIVGSDADPIELKNEGTVSGDALKYKFKSYSSKRLLSHVEVSTRTTSNNVPVQAWFNIFGPEIGCHGTVLANQGGDVIPSFPIKDEVKCGSTKSTVSFVWSGAKDNLEVEYKQPGQPTEKYTLIHKETASDDEAKHLYEVIEPKPVKRDISASPLSRRQRELFSFIEVGGRTKPKDENNPKSKRVPQNIFINANGRNLHCQRTFTGEKDVKPTWPAEGGFSCEGFYFHYTWAGVDKNFLLTIQKASFLKAIDFVKTGPEESGSHKYKFEDFGRRPSKRDTISARNPAGNYPIRPFSLVRGSVRTLPGTSEPVAHNVFVEIKTVSGVDCQETLPGIDKALPAGDRFKRACDGWSLKWYFSGGTAPLYITANKNGREEKFALRHQGATDPNDIDKIFFKDFRA